MDLSLIKKANNIKNQEPSFQGQKTIKNEYGETRSRVTSRHIELAEDEELGIELIRITSEKDPNKPYNWSVSPTAKPIRVETDDDFKQGKKTLCDIDLGRLKNAGEYGYRFVVYEKDDSPLNQKKVKRAYADTVGSRVATKVDGQDALFTVASTKQGTPRTEGAMMHLMVDAYNALNNIVDMEKITPQTTDKEIAKNKRTHTNKAGGTIRGIIEKIKTELTPYKYIMTTPLIGGGSVSAHSYHPKNHFHVTEGMGDKKDFMDLQVDCFNNGKGYVLDGAFTSQGYEGIQLNHALKWKDSCFKNWFKNPSENGYEIGTLSDTDNKNTGIRIVNPKGVKGYKYDPSMPTYIQFYDTRLVSDEQLKDYGKLIDKYDKSNTEDPYEITTWHDSTLTNRFEIDPSTPSIKGRAYGSLEEWDKDGKLHKILNPENLPYAFVRRGQVSGTTGWDGNIDLVKMNLSNHSNSIEAKEGCNQARNYMYNVARYWTTETRNSLIMDIADKIHEGQIENGDTQSEATEATSKYLDKIEKNFSLEKGSLKRIYSRVLKEKNAALYSSQNIEKSYNYKINDDKRSANQAVQEGILNFPLESLNFSDELLAVLSTPYITPRPSAEGKADAGKLEVLEDARNNKRIKFSPVMDEVYTEILPSMVKNLIYEIQTEQTDDKHQYGSLNSKRLYEGTGDNMGELTPYGKYFLEMSMDDIMQFLITEALFEDEAHPVYKDGSLDYTYADKKAGTKGNGKSLNLNKLGVFEATEQLEAEAVAKKIKKGLLKIQDTKSEEYQKFKEYLTNKYYKIDPEDYKIAEAIVDQTGAGLNWRFDATKDVGDWDEAKETDGITAGDVWDDVINFWKPFVKEVKQVNDSSYIVAEVTSLHDFDKLDWGKYGNADKAERAFFQEIPATAFSNYSTFFGAYPKLFGKNVEEGAVENFRSITAFMNKTKDFVLPNDNGHVYPEFILGTHEFLDNHDKPRASHLMALDSAFFWSDFKSNGKTDDNYKKRAENILQREYSDDMNSKAAAVAEQFIKYFTKEGKALGLSDKQIDILNQATVHLANGYKYGSATDKTPNFTKADSFGQTPFEHTIIHVLEQAEAMGLNINKDEEHKIFDAVREDMVTPYESKMPAIYEIMSGTTGIPTLFAGDELAQTGSETKSKNWSLGCRNAVRHDWISINKKDDVVKLNKRLKATGLLHKKPGMSALSDGSPIIIKPDQNAVLENASPSEYVAGLNSLSDNDLKQICGFIENSGDMKRSEIFAKLNSMPKEEMKEKVKKFLSTTSNTGLKNWAMQKIGEQSTEVGAAVKYNDKGDVVVTMVTNAYIPKDVNKIGPLATQREDGIIPPKTSDVVLKDDDGNLIAKPGSIFIRKVYDEKSGDYVDYGKFILNKEGRLVGMDGSSSALDSTACIFYKQKSLWNPHTKPIG